MSKPTPITKRIMMARKKRGLSQKAFGIAAGIDPFVASTRINRYEKGVHEPDIQTLRLLAKASALPVAYFYAEDDELAEVIECFCKLTKSEQKSLLSKLNKILDVKN